MQMRVQELELEARYHQERLLSEAARTRLARQAQARRPAIPSLRSRLAAGLRTLAAWIDDRTPVRGRVPAQAFA